MSGDFWTKEDTALLLTLLDQRPVEVARHFPRRSIVSIQTKMKRLKTDAAIAEQIASEVGDELGESVLRLVRAGRHSISEIADELDRGPTTIQKSVDDLRIKGYRIELTLENKAHIPDQLITGYTHIPLTDFRDGKWFRFGVVSDTHLCFPPTTPIETKDGVKSIASVKVGDMVLTHKNRYRAVTEVMKNPGDGRFTRLHFRGQAKGGSNAFASLVATPDHPVMISNLEGVDSWCRIAAIKPGDYVRIKGKPCRDCDALVPPWFTVCDKHDPFVKDECIALRERRSKQRLGTRGTRHYTGEIVPTMEKWRAEGYRVIPVDRIRPDFIAIKDEEVIAVEIEAPRSGRPVPDYDKYSESGMDIYYDRIEWDVRDPRSKKKNRNYGYVGPNQDGFIAVEVQTVVDIEIRPTSVYNLEVEEDHSYIAKRCVVHNCNKHARLDCLNAAYDTFQAEGIREVLHGGNWVDGEARFNKMELIVPPGHDNQVRYFLANYPKREGIVTRVLSGDDHEGWTAQREGIDVGRHLEMCARAEGRTDIINLGYGEADLPFYADDGKRPAILRLSHPKDGSSYALSYKPQRTVESYDGGSKPQMLFIGHYHKAGYFAWRNVHTLLMGCLESQSYFMRGKQLAAHVGFWIIEFQVANDGSVHRFRQEWTQFFDEGFYRDRYSPGDQPETLVAALPLDVA